MATMTRATQGNRRTHRVCVSEYIHMIVSGVLSPDTRVELLDGILVEQMTKHAPHNFTVSVTAEFLRRLLPIPWLVREEKPIIAGRFWRPEPDLVIVRGPNNLYRAVDPKASDVGLLVEVAESTYATDRGEKWRAYAAARVRVYWIINLPDRQVEVYTDPGGRGKSASYREAAVFGIEDEVPVVIEGHEVGRLAVREILP